MAGYYPDSDILVQKNGLKIDYILAPQAKDYHPDQYIEFALKTLDNL